MDEKTGLSGEIPAGSRFRDVPKHGLYLFAAIVLFATVAFADPSAVSEIDRASRIRTLVNEGQMEQAFQVTENWIDAYPNDVDARAWHARLQAWTNHWQEAENEYRELIKHSPRDVDLLIGLADVLIWQKEYTEALSFLDLAIEIDSSRMDSRVRRAQTLQKIGRTDEAQIIYRELLETNPNYDVAKKGLDLIHAEKHHVLHLNTDLDSFSYTDNATSFGVSVRSQWNAKWASMGSLRRHQRFGEGVTEIETGATYKFSDRDTFTVSGAVAGENGVVPRAKTEFEYSHGFRLAENGPFRGIEAIYRQRWLWYRDTHLLVLSPTALLYLPGNWHWMVQYSPSRIAAAGGNIEWKSSFYTRLSFPVKSRATGYALFARGTENFNYAEQIGELSMQTWGGGMQFRIDDRHEIHGYGKYQRISGDRTLLSAGAIYAFHF